MKRYFEADCDPSLIRSKVVAVVGYGNQGRAQALNLRDQGVTVAIGVRAGKSLALAKEDGFEPLPIREAVRGADLVLMAVPDESMKAVFDTEVQPALNSNAVLVFAHGFAVTYGQITPLSGAILVSPVGPGTAVREQFLARRGVPGFVASEPGVLLPLALAFGWGIGCGRGGMIPTTFREETECDLFGEQVVLCGGMPELAIAAFETLVEAGYSPEVAYNECVQQVALLAKLMAEHGVAGMKQRISDTAEWGSYKTGKRIISEETRKEMKRVLAEIQSQQFAQEWIEEANSGKSELKKEREKAASHPAEKVFRELS